MNNIYITIITTLIRLACLWLSGAALSHLSPAAYNLVNDAIQKLGGPELLVTSVAGTLGMVGLSVWLKMKSRLHLDIALGLPKGSTASEVKNVEESKSILSVLANPQPK